MTFHNKKNIELMFNNSNMKHFIKVKGFFFPLSKLGPGISDLIAVL